MSATFGLSRSAALALAGALAFGAVGCASFDTALGQREVVVRFQPQTPDTVRLRVRAACSHVPQVRPEPLPTGHVPAVLADEVRYQARNASDAELARLQQCLSRFPSVAGIEISEPAGS